jgi:hypothetical protein
MPRKARKQSDRSGRRSPGIATPTGKSRAPKGHTTPRAGRPAGDRSKLPVRPTPSIGRQVVGPGPETD